MSEEKDYISLFQTEDDIQICFYVDNDKVMSIGEKMEEINEMAYMNGYNWEAFFNYYLMKHAPKILENMDSDPEAGLYAAFFELSEENESLSKEFMKIIISLIENEENIYQFIREFGNDIEWD